MKLALLILMAWLFLRSYCHAMERAERAEGFIP